MQKGLAKYSSALTVMAEPMRQTILSMIGQSGRLRGKDLLDRLDLTQPTLSHHMNVLLGAGLITARKEGRCVWYSINKTTIKAISDAILSLNQESTIEIEAKPASVVKVVKTPKKVTADIIVEEPESKDKKEKNKDKDKKKKKKNKDKDKDKTKKKKK